MGWYPPPERAPQRLQYATLAAGTLLYRVHSARFSAVEFNATDPDSAEAGGGGRFDSHAGQPPFLYAGRTRRAAIAESLLRDVPFDERGHRELPAVALAARRVSEIRVVRELRVVALHGTGLARVGQDTWLVRSAAEDYSRTRSWAAAIMSWSRVAAGLEWRPRHDDDGLAVCLYEPRVAAGSLEVVRSLDLWEGEGLAIARAALLAFGVAPPLG